MSLHVGPIILTINPGGIYVGNSREPAKPGDEMSIRDLSVGDQVIRGFLYRLEFKGDGVVIWARSFDGSNTLYVKLLIPEHGETSYELKTEEKNVSIRNIQTAYETKSESAFSFMTILFFVMLVIILAMGGYIMYNRPAAVIKI